MYKLEYLSKAIEDISEIIRYIRIKLNNPTAAKKLSIEFEKATEMLTEFPYLNPVYYPVSPLKKDYRKLIVKNYIMFYYVDETEKTVTVARVIYAKRNYMTEIK